MGRSTKDARGNTVPVQGGTQKRSLREPHERDESADSQAAREPSMERIGAVAHDSVRKGQVDTSKGTALDETYEKLREGDPRPNKPVRR
jgi:hypothetical protein